MTRRLVLVVGGSELIMAPLVPWIRHCGARTKMAHDGATALGMAKSRRPDLLLLNMIMPVEHVAELLVAMDFDPDLQNVPLVIVGTAEQRRAEMRRAVYRLCTPLMQMEFEHLVAGVLDGPARPQGVAPRARAGAATESGEMAVAWPGDTSRARWSWNPGWVWGSVEEYVWCCRPEAPPPTGDDGGAGSSACGSGQQRQRGYAKPPRNSQIIHDGDDFNG